MKNYRTFLRWWLLVSLMMVGLVLALFNGWISMIYDNDASKISVFIALIFAFITVRCGQASWYASMFSSPGPKPGKEVVLRKAAATEESGWFMSGVCMTLGMIGTIVGLIIVFTSGFEDINPGSTESIRKTLTALGSGISTALYTTLMGVVASVGIRLQCFNLKGGIEEANRK